MKELFTIKNYLYDYFYDKEIHKIQSILYFLLSFYVYIRIIKIPYLISNFSLETLFLKKLITLFSIYFSLHFIYIKLIFIIEKSIHKFSYYYILKKLIYIRKNDQNTFFYFFNIFNSSSNSRYKSNK